MSLALAGVSEAAAERVRGVPLEVLTRPSRMSLIEWAETHRRWKDETPYSYGPVPHVREVVEAYEDPQVREIVVMKVTQSGFTQGAIVNPLGFHIDHEPRDLMVVIPAVEEARKWSTKILQPTIDATPALRGKLEEGSRKRSATMLEKSWTGGSLGIVGSNSGKAFRMLKVATVFGDDVDGWDPTAGKGAGSEGDQVTLIRRRTERTPDRKIVWISTPTRNGARIYRLYHQMERRGQWHVPCPHCGEMQVLRRQDGLKWEKRTVERGYRPEPGEVLRGTELHLPETVYYECQVNGCRIEEGEKRWMEERGAYLAEDGRPVRLPGVTKVGYWLRGSLTLTLPGSGWAEQAREFLSVKDNPVALQAFVNTVDGEPWEDRGDAPKWRRLYERRETYPVGTCPEGVKMLTAGADVQVNRIEVFVWGWGMQKESWLVDHRVFGGDPWNPRSWDPLTALLRESWPSEAGPALPLARLAVDTGFARDAVVAWAFRAADRRVMLVKGDAHNNWTAVLGTPSKSDVTLDGKRTGLLLWPVGGALIKQEFYGFLRLPAPLDGDPFPPGYVHLPEVDDEAVKSLVAEDLVSTPDRRGFTKREWVKTRRRNEWLDGRVYAYAAAEQMGLSRLPEFTGEGSDQAPKTKPARDDDQPRSKWIERDRWRGRRGWLK